MWWEHGRPNQLQSYQRHSLWAFYIFYFWAGPALIWPKINILCPCGLTHKHAENFRVPKTLRVKCLFAQQTETLRTRKETTINGLSYFIFDSSTFWSWGTHITFSSLKEDYNACTRVEDGRTIYLGLNSNIAESFFSSQRHWDSLYTSLSFLFKGYWGKIGRGMELNTYIPAYILEVDFLATFRLNPSLRSASKRTKNFIFTFLTMVHTNLNYFLSIYCSVPR
jgi:hypothetical protein